MLFFSGFILIYIFCFCNFNNPRNSYLCTWGNEAAYAVLLLVKKKKLMPWLFLALLSLILIGQTASHLLCYAVFECLAVFVCEQTRLIFVLIYFEILKNRIIFLWYGRKIGHDYLLR